MRTFYTLVASQALSAFGTQVSTFAVGVWVYSETGRATPLALVAFFFTIAFVLAGGVAGALADRFDRRWVMFFADCGAALASLALLTSIATGRFELWHLYAVASAAAFFTACQEPAFLASITLLAPDAQRDRANAIQLIAGPVARLLGPAVGGAIFAAVGVTGAIIVDLATFVVAGVVLLFVRLPRPTRTAAGRALGGGGVVSQLFGGFQYLLGHRRLFSLVAFFSVGNLLFSTCLVVLTPYGLARLGDAAQVGVALGVMNLGAVTGGVVMAAWGGTRPRIHAIMLAIIAEGVFLALCGTSTALWPLAASLFLLGVMPPIANASFISLFQAKVPPDVQGRVFAAIQQLAGAMQPIGALIAGPLADQVFEPARTSDAWRLAAPIVGAEAGAGMGLMFVICGALTIVVGLTVYALPAIRGVEASMPDHDPGLSPAASKP